VQNKKVFFVRKITRETSATENEENSQ